MDIVSTWCFWTVSVDKIFSKPCTPESHGLGNFSNIFKITINSSQGDSSQNHIWGFLAVFTVPTLCHTYSKSYLFFVDLTFGWCPVVVKVILAAVGMVVCSIHCHWESAPWDCTFVIVFKLIGLNLFQNGWASKKLVELSWLRVIVTNRISWSINRGEDIKTMNE